MFDPLAYLGTQYACPADPPRTLDCWELVCRVRRDLGRETPAYVEIADRTHAEGQRWFAAPPARWAQADTPTLGTVVVMGALREHVGVCIGTDQILHMAPSSRRLPQARVDRLRLLRRLFNNELRFYDYA